MLATGQAGVHACCGREGGEAASATSAAALSDVVSLMKEWDAQAQELTQAGMVADVRVESHSGEEVRGVVVTKEDVAVKVLMKVGTGFAAAWRDSDTGSEREQVFDSLHTLVLNVSRHGQHKFAADLYAKLLQ